MLWILSARNCGLARRLLNEWLGSRQDGGEGGTGAELGERGGGRGQTQQHLRGNHNYTNLAILNTLDTESRRNIAIFLNSNSIPENI